MNNWLLIFPLNLRTLHEFAEEHKERAKKHQNELDGKEKNIEHIEIKKTGKIIRKKIDHALNKDKEAKIADILKIFVFPYFIFTFCDLKVFEYL